jgi:aspartyl-tRNA(Asn)/glutamyl-tRNA(Gln) amidotransferase subunit C
MRLKRLPTPQLQTGPKLKYNSSMKFDVNHVARLANLTLSEEEKEKFEKQLEETAQYVEGLNEVETKDTEPTSQVTGLENITREDEVKPSLTQDQALKNAKSTHNGFFKVKGILNA